MVEKDPSQILREMHLGMSVGKILHALRAVPLVHTIFRHGPKRKYIGCSSLQSQLQGVMITDVGKKYELPPLKYGYKDLAPFLSEEQLTLHHDKHHAAYVNGANAILDKLQVARKDNVDLDMKAIAKELSFNVGGHLLHKIFWENLAPTGRGGGQPGGNLGDAIKTEYGSFDRFKKEFTAIATSAEGSETDDNADRKAQRQRLPRIQDPGRSGRMGARLLRGLQEP
jgi:hypothetical protein